MFQGWRFKLREAEQALREGRLEDAGKIIVDGQLLEYMPAQRLLAKVASRLADRAVNRINSGDWVLGWDDFEKSRRLGGASQEWHAARQRIIQVAVQDIEQDLQELNPIRAISRVEELRKRDCANDSVRSLEELARRIQSARNLAKKGRFDDALNQISDASQLRPQMTSLESLRSTYQNNASESQVLTEKLHQAVSEDRWTDAVSFADRLLRISPESRLALETQHKAWKQVDIPRNDLNSSSRRANWAATSSNVASPAGERFLLWVDAVGGYLVCLADEITIGQSVPHHTDVHIPILADLKRLHATIRREADSYLLVPTGPVRVNGARANETRLLSDGDEIELGDGVILQFRKSYALSASARLDFISRHRTQPKADGVLLMAESCVLGPKWQNHVVCRDWSNDVVVYRHNDDLFCRAMESIEVDGELCDGKGRIGRNSHVSGVDFSMSFEEI